MSVSASVRTYDLVRRVPKTAEKNAKCSYHITANISRLLTSALKEGCKVEKFENHWILLISVNSITTLNGVTTQRYNPVSASEQKFSAWTLLDSRNTRLDFCAFSSVPKLKLGASHLKMCLYQKRN